MIAPKASICMPIYNSAAYLAAAIESALSQQYDSLEILILDDCSTDGSAMIASAYAEKFSQIRFIGNENNIGMVANWNRCLELARGKYIKFLFGDDLLSSPFNVQRLADILDQNREVTLACSFRRIIDQNDRIVTEAGFYTSNRIVEGSLAIRKCLISAWNHIGEPTAVMFRKKDAARGFLTGYRQIVDLEMWFHLLKQGSVYCEREALVSFRRHPDQQTAHNAKTRVHIEEMLRIYDTYLPDVRLNKSLKKALYYVQCYQIWKGYIKDGVITRVQAEQVISRYIPTKLFKSMIPLYKILNPLRKLIFYF